MASVQGKSKQGKAAESTGVVLRKSKRITEAAQDKSDKNTEAGQEKSDKSEHLKSWEGGVALVTGASSGIGAAICKELVKQGMKVIGCARRLNLIQELIDDPEVSKGPGKLHAIQCDLAVKEKIPEMFKKIAEEHGKLDVCINNAGIGINSSLSEGLTKDWKAMLAVNVLALSICTKEALVLMKKNKRKDGIIIHMGCVMGHRVPDIPHNALAVPDLGLYYGTKFMVRGLAESLRQELKKDTEGSKIRIVTISPGAVETEFFSNAIQDPKAAKKFYRDFKCLQPEQIAEEVVNVLNTPGFVNVQDIIVQPRDYRM